MKAEIRANSILKVGVSLILICAGPRLYANEGAAEAASGGGEAKPASAKPWLELQTTISTLNTKSSQAKQKLDELIETKKKTKDAMEMSRLDKEIQKQYKEWKDFSEELAQAKAQYRYRYPERAAKKDERFYHGTGEIPTLEKVEEQIGVEGKMSRNLRRMRGQFGQPELKGKLEPLSKEPTKTESEDPGEQPSIRDQSSPLLRK